MQVEWSVLQWILSGRYFTVGAHCCCSLNEVRYSKHYQEDASEQVDSDIAAWMECVTVNIIWKILHSRWTLLLQLEWSVLQWTLSGRCFRAGGYRYCSLNGVRYIEHYLETIAQQVDSDIAPWTMCLTINIKGNFEPWRLEKIWQKNFLVLKFAQGNVAWNKLYSTYFDCTTISVAKVTKFFIPIWKVDIRRRRPHIQKRLNSKPFICSTIGKFSSFDFTKFRKFRHSIRIEVHSFLLMNSIEIITVGCALGLIYNLQCLP